MTPQEESMLNDLIGRVQQTQLTEKDPEAEQLLNQSLGRNPNALYILAQTVLVQNYALEQAQAQLSELRQQTQALQQQQGPSELLLRGGAVVRATSQQAEVQVGHGKAWIQVNRDLVVIHGARAIARAFPAERP